MTHKILVVEDELSLNSLITNKLIQDGFEVFSATDGHEGLNMAVSIHPDCILLDSLMPVMNGITMILELRKDTWGKEAKIILLTNLTSSANEFEAQNNNVTDYLIKSDISLEDISKIVKSKLGIQTL
jgi:two-component system alkaline phosphatase synthesis response regulator PhoP